MPERHPVEDDRADFSLIPVTDTNLQTDVTQAAAVQPQNGIPADASAAAAVDASIAATMIEF